MSSWIPSAKAVASSGVGRSSRSATIPTSVVVSAPSVDRTAASSDTQSGRPSSAVVVEERLFDLRIERNRLELTEARGARDLDDDQPPDGVELETSDLGDRVELLGVQPIEVADVPVQRADGDDGARVQQARGEHRPERVEVRVPMCRDDLLGAHRLIVAEPPASDGARRARRPRSRRARRSAARRSARSSAPAVDHPREPRRPRSSPRSRRDP